MQENLKTFYLTKCKVVTDKSSTTRAYKYGVTNGTFQQRGINAEFNKLLNSNPKLNFLNNSNKIDTDTECQYQIIGPEYFIDALELYIKNEYFANDEPFFSSKEEYINVYEETVIRYGKLCDVLGDHEGKIKLLKETYDEIDNNKSKLLKQQSGLFMTQLDVIKKDLSKWSSRKLVVAQFPIAPSEIIPQLVPSGKDVYASLLTDFCLFKKGNILYLQHNEYHKGQKPTDYRGAFTADRSNPGSEKFQWAANQDFKKYGYKLGQAQIKKVLTIFEAAGKVIEL